MNQAASKIIRQLNIPTGPKGRKDLSVFMVCLAFAWAIWFLIKLSSDSNYTTINYPVVYKNYPADKVLVEKPDSILTLGIKAQGFKLLSAKFFKRRKNIEVDLEKIQVKKSNPHHYAASLATSRIVQKLTSQLNFSKELLSVYPDTLYFSLQDRIKRKVPVKTNTELNIKLPYRLYSPVSIEPDSVTVSGPYSSVNKISFIQTNKISSENIMDDIEKVTGLENPHKKFVAISPKEVLLKADVEEFTEGSVEVPINCILDSNTGFSLKTFPEKVVVNYSFALKDFNRITPELFEVVVDARGQDLENRKMLRVKVKRFPDFVKVARVHPEDVEFIIK